MDRYSRREILNRAGQLGVAAGSVALLAGCSRLATSGSPGWTAPAMGAARGTSLETTTLRFASIPGAACMAPVYVAEELLRADGFTDVQFTSMQPAEILPALADGKIDLQTHTVGIPIVHADTSDATVMLAGVHTGCFELFARDGIRSIADLKGQRVSVGFLGSGRHVHLAAMAAYIGIDPNVDITWTADSAADALRLFTEGQLDAYMAFAPEPQQLRAAGAGRPIVSTSADRPWSHYFCCVLNGNRAFVQNNPVATKRVVRAILKAADICASQPERAAQSVVDRGIGSRDSALQALREIPYNVWREYDPEDTVRFYSLLLQQVGMIKSAPDKIIKQGTDWRFLNELKQELKA